MIDCNALKSDLNSIDATKGSIWMYSDTSVYYILGNDLTVSAQREKTHQTQQISDLPVFSPNYMCQKHQCNVLSPDASAKCAREWCPKPNLYKVEEINQTSYTQLNNLQLVSIKIED